MASVWPSFWLFFFGILVCSVPDGGAGDSAERFGGKHQLWQSCCWDQLSEVRRVFKVSCPLSYRLGFSHLVWHTLSLQVRLQYQSEGSDAHHNQSGPGVPFPSAGPTAYHIPICGSAPPCMYVYNGTFMSRHTWLKWVLVLLLTSSQLLKKWTPVFKNYVKKTQDQIDCLFAFEEHFLEQDTHWAAMFKVAITHIKADLQLQRKTSVMEPHVFFHSGPHGHVPTGDPGGGDDTAMVLPGSRHRQEQTAPQKPGGMFSSGGAARGYMTQFHKYQHSQSQTFENECHLAGLKW